MARNPGSANKATSYAERLRLGIAVIHGEQKGAESDEVDGRYSPPTLPRSRTMDAGVGVPAHPAKEKPPINVVGDVGGRIAIMVDDLIDDVQSFVAAAEVLKERGAYKIYVLATHGLLSSDAPRLIEDSPIDEVSHIYLVSYSAFSLRSAVNCLNWYVRCKLILHIHDYIVPSLRSQVVPSSVVDLFFFLYEIPRCGCEYVMRVDVVVTGGCDKYNSARAPEDAMSQNKNSGHLDSALGGNPPYPQQGINVLPLQERHARGLACRGSSLYRVVSFKSLLSTFKELFFPKFVTYK